jgi:hypothetical protein
MNDMFLKFEETIKMSIFSKIKTNNCILDTIITTVILTITGYVFNNVHKLQKSLHYLFCNIYNITHIFKQKCVIEIEGEKNFTSSVYATSVNISANYSNRFKAFWFYLIKNIDKIHHVYNVKEMYSTIDPRKTNPDLYYGKDVEDIFMVDQIKPIEIEKDIFVVCNISKENKEETTEKTTIRREKITIKIYSYKYNFSHLKKFIDNIKDEYLSSIKTNRFNKKFIYTLENDAKKNDDGEIKFSNWSEVEFYSCRTFSNMFFYGKNELIEKIDFFINNREWYESKGIPWTCGIGLHGPPGTGKTSFIKSLANYTNRHLIFISLKLIKTKRQLYEVFFEDTYNIDNDKKSINFKNKIIVLEDIDCIGDIVLKRENKLNKTQTEPAKTQTESINVNINVNEVIKNIVDDFKTSKEFQMIGQSHFPAKQEEPITLDDLLNLWDGIRETPGRILIITSNHYDCLDVALIRPGRIDISHEFKNASHQVISEMYFHLFKNEIKKEDLLKINEFFYSPAEITNIFLSTKTEEGFVERIIQNIKVV